MCCYNWFEFFKIGKLIRLHLAVRNRSSSIWVKWLEWAGRKMTLILQVFSYASITSSILCDVQQSWKIQKSINHDHTYSMMFYKNGNALKTIIRTNKIIDRLSTRNKKSGVQ